MLRFALDELVVGIVAAVRVNELIASIRLPQFSH